MRTGTANLPLHGGKCPPWLFVHMKELAPAVIRAIAYEYGTGEVLRRLSDPVWFQAFGCLLGFDWHASGLTTTVCGAIKEGLKPYQGELGIFVAGGKGRTSRKTPLEIEEYGEKYGLPNELQQLKYASRMAAKVDNNALQDGYQIYHHLFVFTADGRWTVVQQGMNTENRYARRYHWLSSYRDPVRYSFAHGGKDGFPFPVNRETYTSSIASLETALAKAKIGDLTKMKALKRLAYYTGRIVISHP